MRQQNDFADQVEQVEAEKQKYLNQVNEMAFERKEAGKLKPQTIGDCFLLDHFFPEYSHLFVLIDCF